MNKNESPGNLHFKTYASAFCDAKSASQIAQSLVGLPRLGEVAETFELMLHWIFLITAGNGITASELCDHRSSLTFVDDELLPFCLGLYVNLLTQDPLNIDVFEYVLRTVSKRQLLGIDKFDKDKLINVILNSHNSLGLSGEDYNELFKNATLRIKT